MTLRNISAREEIKRRVETEKDAVFQGIRDKTPAQVDAWIENNVTGSSSVKSFLKMLAKIILFKK